MNFGWRTVEWNKVTWYSNLVALIVFFAVLALGFYIGREYGEIRQTELDARNQKEFLKTYTLVCSGGKQIQAQFLRDSVLLDLSDGRTMTLLKTASNLGRRYSNVGESFVFRDNNQNFLLQEGTAVTYSDCMAKQ